MSHVGLGLENDKLRRQLGASRLNPMTISAPYSGSFNLWYRVEVHCSECQSPSELKLVAGEFLCCSCRTGFRGGDSVGFASSEGGVGAGRSAFSASPRSVPKSSQMALLSDRLSPSDPFHEGEGE